MNDTKEEERHEHPSYGQIGFSRISGHQRFYGSELEQDHYIEMTVKNSEITRTLTGDHFYKSGKNLIKVRMSSGQFAEMITNMNCSGVPCTVEWVNGVKQPALPPMDNRKEFVHRKFSDRMDEFSVTLREKQLRAQELIKKKTLSKDDQRELGFLVTWLTQEVSSNIPFFGRCFQETMDEVVVEAKTEIENAIQHKINTLGLAALHEEQNLLLQEKNTDPL